MLPVTVGLIYAATVLLLLHNKTNFVGQCSIVEGICDAVAMNKH